MNYDELNRVAEELLLDYPYSLPLKSFCIGAEWANEQNAAEIARLEAEKAELLALLEKATEFFDYDDKLKCNELLEKHGIK